MHECKKWQFFLTILHQNSIPSNAIIKTPDLNYKRSDFSRGGGKKKPKPKPNQRKGGKKFPTRPYKKALLS